MSVEVFIFHHLKCINVLKVDVFDSLYYKLVYEFLIKKMY